MRDISVVSGSAEEVAVVGYSARLPGAASTEQAWAVLNEGRCTVGEISPDRWSLTRYFDPNRDIAGKCYSRVAGLVDNVFDFDAGYFSLSPREAEQMDPQQRLLLEVVAEAFDHAGIDTDRLDKKRTGVFVGASSSDHSTTCIQDPKLIDAGYMLGNTLSIISNRISYHYDLHGPSFTIDTACSSGIFALDQARRAIASGEIDTAVVGSVNVLLSPMSFVGFSKASMLSETGICQAFGENADGYVRSEGAVVFILRNASLARLELDRIRSMVVASGTNSDGRTPGIAMPSSERQHDLLEDIKSRFNIDPERLAFIEAHGTGTAVGDPEEARAIGQAFGMARSKPLPIGSAKTNFGHLEPAAGLVGLLKAQLALEKKQIPASLHSTHLNPNIAFDELGLEVVQKNTEIPDASEPWLAAVNSFGFGGANAHAVLQQADEQNLTKGAMPRALMITAASDESLTALAETWREKAEVADSDLAQSILAANRRLTRHRRRLCVPASSPEFLKDNLDAWLGNPRGSACALGTALRDRSRVGFVFSGNGSQWAGMGRHMLLNDKVFRDSFSACSELATDLGVEPLLDLIMSPDLGAKLDRAPVAQPMLLAVQVSLVDALAAQGLHPGAVLGHSAGEVAAAYACGAITRADAIRIIVARSQTLDQLYSQGTMAALACDTKSAENLIETANLDVEVAGENSGSSITVSGTSNDVAQLLKICRSKRIAGRRLQIEYPYHSFLTDPLKSQLLDELEGISGRDTEVSFFSGCLGKQVPGSTLDSNFWWLNARKPVRFKQCVEAMAERGISVFLEISPKSVLQTYVRETLAETGHSGTVLGSLEETDSGKIDAFSITLNALSNGAEVDEDLLLGEKPGNAEQMPVYPFDRKPFRLASETPFDFFGRKKQHALLGGRIDPNADVWTSDLSLGRLPWLADHKVDGSVVLPAAAIVEMFLSAASEIVAAEGVELRHVEILKPIRLTETGVVPIRMTYDAPSRRLTLEQNQSGAWNWVAGAAVFQLGSVEGRGLDLAAGKKATDFYQTLSGMGLEYGPSFARMAHVSVGKSSVDVRLSESQIDQNGLLLDPTGIDACLHAALPLLETLDTSENKIFVPGRFGKLKLFKSGTCVGARLSLVGGDTSGVCFDAIFVDPEGAPLAGVEDMWLRPMPRLKRNEIRYYDERFVPVQPRSSLSGLELPESVFRLEESAPDDLEVLRDAIAGRIAWDIVNSSNDNEFRDRRYQSALLSLEDMGLLEIRDLSPTALTGECPWPDLSSLLELLVDTQPSASDELQATMHAAVSDRRNENAGIDALRDVSLSLVGSLPEKIGRAVILGDVDPAVFKRLLDIAEYVVVALDRPDKADTLRLDLKNSEKSFFTTIDHAATLPNFDLILGLGLASKPPAQHQKSLSSLLKSGSHLLLVDYASDLFETMTGRYTDEISVDVLDGQIAHLCNIVQRRPSRDYSHVRVLSTGLLSRDTAESEASPVVFGQSNFANDLRSDPPALCSSTVAILALDSESDQITSMLLQAENARNLPADSETIWLAQRGQKGADALLGLRRVLANETGRDVRAMLVDNDVPPEKVVSLAASSLERELFVSQDLVSTKRITPAFNSKLSLGPDEKAILRQSNRGRLETLDWSKETRREPGPSEIEISVTATALNFRDVMLAQGLLQSDLLEGGFAGPTLGMELSGTVVRAGNDARFSPGQRVIAFASDAFATHVTVDERAAIAAPDDVDLNIAAALPVIFITAEYALTELARIRADEWVLIHGGAGGVGLAAIQVANRAGARIIATAGSDEKRTLLKSLGVQHVCDSRSLAFSDYVEEVTNGHGVDVLVNSLAGEAMERSIGTLAPFGRFIELGKRDFAANSSIGLRALKDNISYFAVDADKLLKHRPEIVADTMARVIETFDEGEYTAPPTRQFPAEMAEQAFRLMQRSAHVGKILITPPDTEVASETKTLSFAGQWLIAGGTKGFGLSTAKWLADQGATGLWLVSRSGKTDDASLVNGLKTKGVDVQVRAADLTQPDEVDALMDDVANHCGGLNGIVCGTAVFNDAFLDDVSKEDYARVVSAKLGAALELDRASRRFELDHFWLYSSVAARFGNPGQSAYCAANAELEAVARERNEQDLPALAISWGPIGNAGYLERSEDVKSALERKLGGLMSSQSALDALGTALKSGHGSATLTVAQIDWSRLRSDLPVISEPLFEFLSTSGSSEDDENGIDIAALIASIGEAKTRRKVLDILRKEAAAIMRIAPMEIDADRPLSEMGFDSLMGMNLKLAIEERLGTVTQMNSIADGMTLAHLAALIVKSAGTADEISATENMAERHLTEIDLPEVLKRKISSDAST